MIMDCDRQGLLGVILAYALEVNLPFNLSRLGNADPRLMFLGLGSQFFVEDLFAQNNTIVADIDAWAGDEFFDFGMRLPAKTAQGDISGSRHRVYSFLSAKLVARSTNPGISFLDWTTSSTKP